jgi:hypothetical protein
VVRRLHHLVHLLNLVNDMDLKMLKLHLCVVDSFLIQFLHLLDVAHLDALQNLDEQNLDAHLSYLDVVHQFLVVVVVDVELHHLLRKDYFLDVVGVELRHQLRMDYFLGAELQELLVQLAQLVQEQRLQPLLLLLQLSLHHVMP